MKRLILLALSMLIITACGQQEEAAKEKSAQIVHTESIDNVKHPRILYWFITEDLLENERYLEQLDTIADGPFDLIFITERTGVSFYDYEKMHPILEKMVARAKEHGMGIGLQLWPEKGAEIPVDKAQGMLVDNEAKLNAQGKANIEAKSQHARFNHPLKSELLAAWAFDKTGEGFYKSGSLIDITEKCRAEQQTDTNRLKVTIDAGPEMAGKDVFVLTVHYFDYACVFSGWHEENFGAALEAYADIPFDGLALDEFGAMKITPSWHLKGRTFRERTYSTHFAKHYEAVNDRPLTTDLLAMRYVAEGQEATRMSAINRYVGTMRKGPVKVEEDFYTKAKRLYGDDVFIGVHNTFHNGFQYDEIWTTGINWWDIRRDYGHSDEFTPLSVQMGILSCYDMPVMYNMFYHSDMELILKKALFDARYGIRTHYHAANDNYGWGHTLHDPLFLQKVTPIEEAVALLNRFTESKPTIDLLVVVGMEALGNWSPEADLRNLYDMNKNVALYKLTDTLENNGYVSAIIPSDEVEKGRVKCKDGKVIHKGNEYQALLYYYPNYAKEPMLKLMEEAAANGKLILWGDAKNDFDGKDIADRYTKIAEQSLGTFSLEKLKEAGISEVAENYTVYRDGSHVFTHYGSSYAEQLHTDKISLGGHEWEFSYRTLCAIDVSESGQLEKLAARQLSSLKRDGQEVIKPGKPVDLLMYEKDGQMVVELFGEKKTSIELKLK